MKSWKVWALQAGRSRMDRSFATYLEGMGELIVIPHVMFLLRGPSVVLVDTSFESADVVTSAYPQEIWRTDEEEPVKLLSSLGVKPSEIEMIACTHLHYDHCGSNRLFPQAPAFVQRAELDYALNPTSVFMQREFFSPAGGFRPPFDQQQLRLVDGDHEIVEGVTLLHLPGHTPGSQGVLVQTGQGPLCIAGDLVMVAENFDKNIPVGLHTDVDACYQSLSKVREHTDWVVPTHDLRLFDKQDLIVEVA
jgi:N-acyl homoserine lactone hydrolase